MKALKVLSVIALGIVIASAQPSDQPYAFKDDVLGMGLADFQKAHRDPGYWTLNANGKKVWNTRMSCKADAPAITSCAYVTTIASVPASAIETFVDGKLMAISLSFSYDTAYLASVQSALSQKFGTPAAASSERRNLEQDLIWSNMVSSVELEPRLCTFGQEYSPASLAQDIEAMLKNQYCLQGQMLSYGYSRVFFVDKAAATTLMQRIGDGVADQKKKANGDL